MNKQFLYAAGLIVMTMLACNFPTVTAAPIDTAIPNVDVPTLAPEATPEPLATVTQDVNGPDFIVEIISIDKTTIVRAADPWTWVYYRVTNIGKVAFPGEIHMQSYSNGEANSGYIRVEGPFEPGVPVDSQVAVGDDDFWELGDYSYYMTVDYNGQVNESNEANNSTGTITFTVIAP